MTEPGLSSPWLSIWTKPKATIAEIIQINPNHSIWVLAFIYGFSSLLNFFQSLSLGMYFAPITLYILAAVLAPFWGYAVFSVVSWVVFYMGRLLKGTGSFQEVRAAYSWSCVPLIFSAVAWVVVGLLFGEQVFLNYPDGHLFSDAQVLTLFGVLIVKVVFAIWSLVIYFNALAQVERFSVVRAIGASVLAAVAFIVALMLIQFLMMKLGNMG